MPIKPSPWMGLPSMLKRRSPEDIQKEIERIEHWDRYAQNRAYADDAEGRIKRWLVETGRVRTRANNELQNENMEGISAPDTLVSDLWKRWNGIIRYSVEFSLSDSIWHGADHCSRVLLYALVIGEAREVSLREMLILSCAAAYHDAKRQDEWEDPGHGQRSADYLLSVFADAVSKNIHNTVRISASDSSEDIGTSFLYSRLRDDRIPVFALLTQEDIEFASSLIALHDVPDDMGFPRIEEQFGERGVELLSIFKDADALDRTRFGKYGINESYLRTSEAGSMIEVAMAMTQVNI